ncbi:unnamed protein product [Candidula unifasciata]|uniref:Uncharacterized protein n=1 Tax=Candidula unifasciata TaxID=100452 RepID=A0A8S3Z0E8_9EUPU|nr:unnamed protein product [Candidula unifasciata]
MSYYTKLTNDFLTNKRVSALELDIIIEIDPDTEEMLKVSQPTPAFVGERAPPAGLRT